MEKKNIVAAMGFFDGVHKGHGELLKAAKKYADENDAKSAVITFDRRPMNLVNMKQTELINTLADKKKIISEKYGIDMVIPLPFDKNLMETPWDAFVRDMVDQYGISCFVVGFDFHFGYKGEGNYKRLQELCQKMGIGCIVIDEVTIDGMKVSSTHIRSFIKDGKMKKANEFLGHRHILTEKIITGNQIGRTIGVPTANMIIPQGIITPRYGVYAADFITEDRKRYRAVTNVGVRPTVSGEGVTVESHIIDFSGDIYGSICTVEFIDFLRDEKKFSGIDELKKQIEKDINTVRNV